MHRDGDAAMSRAKLAKLYAKTGPPPKCYRCGRRLGMKQPRLQDASGSWLCPDCAYLRDHPDAPRVTPAPKSSEGPREHIPFPYPTRHKGGDPGRVAPNARIA